jgi:hypothetical protein
MVEIQDRAGAVIRTDYFYGDPALSGNLTFGSQGQLSGTVGITTLGPLFGNPGPGTAYTITNGLLTFNLGSPAGGNASQGFNFQYGGSLSITGSFDGGPQETLFSCVGNLNGGFLSNDGSNHWRFFPDGLPAVGVFVADVKSAYHGGLGLLPEFDVNFSGVSGAVDAGAVVYLRDDVNPLAGVPEPASLALLAIGLTISAGLGRRPIRAATPSPPETPSSPCSR